MNKAKRLIRAKRIRTGTYKPTKFKLGKINHQEPTLTVKDSSVDAIPVKT